MTDSDDEKLESSAEVDETRMSESPPAQTTTGYILPLVYIFLVAIILADVFYVLTQGPEIGIMRPARETLREIGMAELAYQAANNDKVYGGLQALRSTGALPPGDTDKSFIKHYSLSWEIVYVPPSINMASIDGGIQTSFFTVIAWPDRQRVFFTNLKTYAITEDQRLRQFEPANGNRLKAIHTWDPVIEP